MPSIEKRSRRALFLFLLWLGIMAGCYWFYFLQPLHWFDASQTQPPPLSHADQQHRLRQFLSAQFPQLDPAKVWLVRFRQGDCRCERFVDQYHQQLTQQRTPFLQSVTLDLQDPQLDQATRHWLHESITASPAVAVFDPHGELAYFGPYHQEGICSADNSFLEPVLALLQQHQTASILNTLVYGCFCPSGRG